jgi:hypothetical protein
MGQLARPPEALTTNESPDQGTFLLLHDPALKESAQQWAAYRASDGWRVIVQPASAPAAVKPSNNDAARSIRNVIREHWQSTVEREFRHIETSTGERDSAPSERPLSPVDVSTFRFMVLLLGDAPAIDETDFPGVPTWRFPQTDPDMQLWNDRTYISDHPYQLMDDADDLPDVPLGRIPARTNAEAAGLLAKIQLYERGGAGRTGRNRMTYVAGEGHFGLMDNVLESMFKTMIDQLVPGSFDVNVTYAKATSIYCPPPSQLADTVLERLGEGCLLFNYVGHGYERGFDWLNFNERRVAILRAEDLTRLGQFTPEDAQRPMALLTCCSTGWFDLPGSKHCLAEAMLFDVPPSVSSNGAEPVRGGPVAVIAGSRVTHPYANIIVQKDVTTLLVKGRAPTLGLLDLLATRSMVEIDAEDEQLDGIVTPVALAGQWKSSLTKLRSMHMRLYNLLGDPAMRLNLPSDSIHLSLDDLQLSGTVPDMAEGRATITIETARVTVARPGDLNVVTDAADPDLEIKTANNYKLANDRVLLRLNAAVHNGSFEVMLNEAMPARAAVIRAYASGSRGDGTPCDALGAISFEHSSSR